MTSSWAKAQLKIFLSFIDHSFEKRRKILRGKQREGSIINIKLILDFFAKQYFNWDRKVELLRIWFRYLSSTASEFLFHGLPGKSKCPLYLYSRLRCFGNICSSLKKDYIVYLEIFGESIWRTPMGSLFLVK